MDNFQREGPSGGVHLCREIRVGKQFRIPRRGSDMRKDSKLTRSCLASHQSRLGKNACNKHQQRTLGHTLSTGKTLRPHCLSNGPGNQERFATQDPQTGKPKDSPFASEIQVVNSQRNSKQYQKNGCRSPFRAPAGCPRRGCLGGCADFGLSQPQIPGLPILLHP